MAISTYSELKDAIESWTHRTDLDTYLDEFIDLTEAKLNRKLRMSEMEVRATTTITSEYTALPTAFLEMRNIQVNSNPVQVLEYKTPAQMDRFNSGEAGTPTFYTIIGDELQVYPVPTSVTVEITYYKEITALSSTNTSNFLLADFPDVYLHGCLQQAFTFMHNAEAALMHAQEFERLIGEISKTSRKRKFSGAPMRVEAA